MARPPSPVEEVSGEVLGRLARYSGSNVLRWAMALVYAYAKPRFLDPAQLGLWNILNLVPVYGGFLHLGARNALELRIPKLLAQGRESDAATVIGSVHRATLVANAVIGVALLGMAFSGVFGAAASVGLAILAPAMLLIWYHDQQLAVLKAEQRFEVLSKANVLRAATLTAVGIPLVIWHGFVGVCIGFVLTHAVIAAYFRWRSPMRRVGPFDAAIFLALVREGAPVLAFVASLTLLSTVDRLLVGWLLGMDAVGYYSVALVATTFALQVPRSARDMLEPRLMARSVDGMSQRFWQEFVLRPLLNAAGYFPFIVGGIAFLGDDVLAALLPRYLPSALPAVVLCAGCYFLTQIHLVRGIVFAHGWQLRVLPFHLAGTVINLALSIALVRVGWGIVGVATASGLSFAATMTFILLYALRHSPLRPREWLPAFAAVFLAPAASGGMMALLSVVLLPAQPALLPSLLGLVLFVLAQVGLIALLRHRFPDIRPLPLPRALRARWRRRGARHS